MFSDDLSELLNIYFTNKKNFKDIIKKYGKEKFVETIFELLDIYSKDKNSSTLREFITLSIAGYDYLPGKIGFNGKTDDKNIEVKPVNIWLDQKRKHNGGGNFTDFTYGRYEKYKNENLYMLISGFIDGELVFIIEFPYIYNGLLKRLKEQLDNHYPERKDVEGDYLRSASFNYNHYKDCENLKLIYLDVDLLNLYDNKYFTRGFLDLLKKLKKER
jgi:hypothetical protein